MGLVEFAYSRAHRLYPTYWLFIALAWVAVLMVAPRIDPLIVIDS